MSRSKSKRKKKSKHGMQSAKPCPKKMVASIEAHRTEIHDEPGSVDLGLLAKLHGFQLEFDKNIEYGLAALQRADLEGAREFEQQARQAWRNSKALVGIEPIKPSAVRKLAQEIIKQQVLVDAGHRAQLSQMAGEVEYFLNQIHAVVSFSRFSEFVFGDIVQALEIIRSADPLVVEAGGEQVAELRLKLETTLLHRQEQMAEGVLQQIRHLMVTDTKKAIDLLNKEAELINAYYRFEEVRYEIELSAPQAADYQRLVAEISAESKVQEEKQNLRDYYTSLIGSRCKRIKPGTILRNLKEAQIKDPARLARAISASLQPGATYETELARFEYLFEEAKATAQGFRDLEWVSSSSTAEELFSRLANAYERGHLLKITQRVFRRLLDLLFPHREEIFKVVVELLKRECPFCLEYADWLCEVVFSDYFYIPIDETLREIDLFASFVLARQKSMTICDKVRHKPKRNPWDRRH